jgi:hypothetical protein
VLNDAEITRHYRVIAFDMPWHGKSSWRARSGSSARR